MDAGAVPGLAVCVHGTAVPHGAQGVDAGLHHVAPRAPVQGRDQADAARIVLVLRAVGFVKQSEVGVPVGDMVHDGTPYCP